MMLIVAAIPFMAQCGRNALGRKTAMVDPDMGQWTYQYDNAGNLITQTDALSQSLLLAYDPLNRLTGKWYSTPLALTGQSSVPAGQIWKSYYRAGGPLIALRVDGDPITATNGLFFLHTDHLGSASLTTNATGGLIARQLYDAWGNVRTDTISGTMPTDVGYTGQYLDKATGNLVFLNARYYLPASGRFLSADTIVPGAANGSGGGAGTLGYDKSTRLTPLTTDFHEFIAQVSRENAEVLQFGPFFMWSGKVRKEHNVPMGPLNPQALNRYSYVLNNPVRYADPSGHFAWLALLADLAVRAVSGLVSGIANAVTVASIEQVTSGGVNAEHVAIAFGTGFVAGAIAPGTAQAAIVVNAAANGAQYALTAASDASHGAQIEPVSFAIGMGGSVALGGLAGKIAGPAAQPGPTGTQAFWGFGPILFADGFKNGTGAWINMGARIGARASQASILRSTGAAIVSSMNPAH